jgi:phosphoglycerate dehydrogenase-like enzyme
VTADSLAEFALAAMFAAAKQLPEVWIDDGRHWQQRPLASLAGSTLGLYGFGSIAQSLAGKALALGMEVIALRRSHALSAGGAGCGQPRGLVRPGRSRGAGGTGQR